MISGTGGGGDYGEHKYWRYQVGSSTTIHHPNIARIVLVTTGGTEIDIVTVTADNCSDSGSFNSTTLGATYTNPNNSTASNFNPFTTDINAVRGQETGYATMNPLDAHPTGVLSEGNLKWDGSSSSTHRSVRSTLSMRTGKYYAEGTVLGNGNTVGSAFGIALSAASLAQYIGQTNGYSYHFNGNKYPGGLSFGTAYGATLGNVVGLAFDADNGNLDAYLNGVYQGRVVSGLLQDDYFWAANAYSAIWGFNFGQKPFKFPPPAGFQPLNGANARPEKVFARPDQFVGVKLYTGNGTTKNVNVGLKPDLVWLKSRTSGGSGYTNNVLVDTVRGLGTGGYRNLYSNTTEQEYNPSSSTNASVTSIDSTGFTLGGNINTNTDTMTAVAWSWKAGGNKNTFNVDDVGYANASDVGMNVGGQNSNAYNQTQTWSNGGGSGLYSGSTWGSLFDGTPPVNGSNIAQSPYVTNNGSSTLTFSTAISGVLKFKACQGSNSTSGGDSRPYVTLSDGQAIRVDGANNASSSHSFGIVSNITSLSINGTSAQGMNLLFLELDGKLLVDNGVTPPNVPSIAATGSSVGTKQGFSIVSYTSESGTGTLNATIPHGLNADIGFMIIKSRDFVPSSKGWAVWHQSSPTTNGYLDDSQEFLNSEYTSFIDANPTNSVFSVKCNSSVSSGNRYRTYGNSHNYIAYLWHDVPGLQKFGKYTGNNNADGPFIELGFRPSVIIIKRSDGGTENWTLWDASRNTTNVMGKQLYPNLNAAEADAGTNSAYGILDFVSNGVKIRGSHTSFNSSGHTFVYAAWAEAPTFNLYGAQSNAR